ncbi:MAG: response regulator transcription factor [Alsobacter sp.]
MQEAGFTALVADDDAFFRLALGTILRRQFGCATVLEAGSLDEALEHLGTGAGIGLALFDLAMPGMRRAASLAAVRECHPEVRVAVVSGSQDRTDILQALAAGVHGYVPKSLGPQDLAGALGRILEGDIYVPRSLADGAGPRVGLLDGLIPPEPQAQPGHGEAASLAQLTPRQRDVLALLVEGKSNKEIARQLGLGGGTVKIHVAALLRAFGARNRAGVAAAGAGLLAGSGRGRIKAG